MTWTVNKNKCLRCGACVSVCPQAALELVNLPEVNEKCNKCGICVWTCPVKAIELNK